jgi:uncharacterized membrane protein
MSRHWLALFVFGFALNACGDDPPVCAEEDEEGSEIGPTDSVCNGSNLTYDNFGQAFMQKYCTECHSSSKKGDEARQCAPDDHNFDDLDAIIEQREHIDEHAAAGPNGVNDVMPPKGEAKPTEQERRDLGTWLACEEERMP